MINIHEKAWELYVRTRDPREKFDQHHVDWCLDEAVKFFDCARRCPVFFNSENGDAFSKVPKGEDDAQG